MKSRAFTLIELLVVIAIIAVLLAILMPALKRVRQQARSLNCRSNIRTLTLAWNMYKDENDGELVGGHPPLENSGPWVRNHPDGANATVEQKQEYIKRGTLWPYVNELDVYRCPSDMRKKSPYHQYAFRTYSIAGGMNGVAHTGGWEILPCIKFGDIKRPATKYVFLAECDPRGYNMGSWVMYPKRREWVDPFGVWHSDNSSSIGYADGHAEMQRFRSQGLVDWNVAAVYEPQTFSFYRTPADEEEWQDFEVMLDGYAYRQFSQ